LLRIINTNNRNDGAEAFLVVDAHNSRHASQDGRLEVSAFIAAAGWRLCSFLFGLSDLAFNEFALAFAYQGPYDVRSIARIANRNCLGFGHEPLAELIEDWRLD
jgi:hypothetical protein